jgi:hypothetical protein
LWLLDQMWMFFLLPFLKVLVCKWEDLFKERRRETIECGFPFTMSYSKEIKLLLCSPARLIQMLDWRVWGRVTLKCCATVL